MSDKILSIDEIETIDDTQFVTVSMPEWGASVRLGSITAEDVISWSESNEGDAKKTAGLRMIAASLVDAEGNRIGTGEKTVTTLRKKSASSINRLIEAVTKLNKLNVEAKEVKNGSGEVTSVASPTA